MINIDAFMGQSIQCAYDESHPITLYKCGDEYIGLCNKCNMLFHVTYDNPFDMDTYQTSLFHVVNGGGE